MSSGSATCESRPAPHEAYGARSVTLGAITATCILLSLTPSIGAAQDSTRRAVTVDYVGVEGVYLPVGTEQGAEVGDTLEVYATATATTPVGLLVFSAASRSRSVTQPVDGAPTLIRGDVIYLELVPEDVAAVIPGAPATREPSASNVAEADQAAGRGGPRLTGRASLDLDARETRTSWEGELFGTTRRRYATPVSSLYFRLSELPGGFTVESQVRASYRYSDGVAIQPTTSVRVYNLSVTKEFDAAPVQIRAGRFYNPYESYSSYWDGALLRLGGRSGGVGVVMGFDPERGNEGLSQDVAKLTGFVDISRRFGTLRYDSDVSFHVVRPRIDGLPDRSFAGWSQRVSFGRFDVSQRLRLDRSGDTGEWSLAQVRVRGGLLIAPSLRLRLGFGRTAPAVLRGVPAGLGSDRDEITAGATYFAGRNSVSVDLGSTRWAGEDHGLSVSGAAGTQVGRIRLYASGRRWWRGDMSSTAMAPSLGFDLAGLSTRFGYQMYRTEGAETLTSHSGNLELSARPAARLWVTLRGEQQWGGNFAGTRVRLSLGRSF